jgi:hypothetical protein
MALMGLKNYKSALELFKDAISFNKKYVKPYIGLGDAYSKL